MKTRLIIAIVLTHAFIFHANSAWPSGSSDSLSLELSLDKDSYLFGESILMVATIRNLTDDTLQIVDPSLLTNIKILGDNGIDFTSSWIYVRQLKPALIQLLPKDSVISWHSILPDYLGDLENPSDLTLGLAQVKRLRVSYANQGLSNWVELSFSALEGSEKAELDSLIEIVASLSDRIARKGGVERLGQLNKLFPNSRWNDEIDKLRLRFAVANRDSTKILAFASELIARHPNDAISLKAVGNVLSHLPRQAISQAIDTIFAKSRNSLAEVYYNQTLKRKYQE